MKRITSLLLTLLLLVTTLSMLSVGTVSAAGDIPVYVDGVAVVFDVKPQIINDRTMVPLRAIFEALGAKVDWDDSTKTAISEKDGTTVKITIGQYAIVKNDVSKEIDVPAQIVDSRTLVPVRAIAESFDCRVFWDDAARCVQILTFNLPEAAGTTADTTVAAKIGDHEVSKAMVDCITLSMNKSTGKEPTADEVLDTCKAFFAIEDLAAEYGVVLSVSQQCAIECELHALLNSGAYESSLASVGATDTFFRELLNYSALLENTNAAVFNSIHLSDEEIVAYVRKNYVRVKHILLKSEDEAKAIVTSIAAGEKSFDELLSKSVDTTMDKTIGFVFGKDTMVEPFETASFALEEGSVSGVVATSYGYHIIARFPMSEVSDEYILSDIRLSAEYDAMLDAYNTLLNEKIASYTVTQ